MDASGKNWYVSNMNEVETYNLFGERDAFPDVVHCETIEARSVMHDWSFKPHRHARLHQFLLVESGGGSAQIEDQRYALIAGDLLNVPMGLVHGFRFKPGTQGLVVTVSSEGLEDSLHDSEGVRPMLKIAKKMRFTTEIHELMRGIFREYPSRNFARAHVLRALCGVLVGLVAREIAAHSPVNIQGRTDLQRRFEALVEQNYTQHLSVTDYAEKLAVTPTHLSRVMRQATGQSASAVIEGRIIQEARRNLAFSNISVSEIGYHLGFSDPAYFSRVFKRVTGQSPRDFRAALGE